MTLNRALWAPKLVTLAATLVLVVAAAPSNALVTEQQEAPPAGIAAEVTPDPIQEQQLRIAEYIARHWRVNLDHAVTVVSAAFAAAARYQVDPILILAIAAKESSFRHVGNNPNHTYGIMQIIGRYHKDKFEGGQVRATSVTENILMGTHILRENLDRERGDLRRALMRYNASPARVQYSRAVLRLKTRINQVMHTQDE